MKILFRFRLVLLMCAGFAFFLPAARSEESPELLAVSYVETTSDPRVIEQTPQEPVLLILSLRNKSASSFEGRNLTRQRELEAIRASDEFKKAGADAQKEIENHYAPADAPQFRLGSAAAPLSGLIRVTAQAGKGTPSALAGALRPVPGDKEPGNFVVLDAENDRAVFIYAVPPEQVSRLAAGRYVLRVDLDTNGKNDMWNGVVSDSVELILKAANAGSQKDRINRLKVGGEYRLLNGEYQAAIGTAEEIFKLNKDEIDGWLLKGDGQMGLKDYANALESYTRALDLYNRDLLAGKIRFEGPPEPPVHILSRLDKVDALAPDAHAAIYEKEMRQFKAEVMALEGEVTATDRAGISRKLAAGDLIDAGDAVQTGGQSRADLSYDNEWKNVVRIGENTKVAVRTVMPISLELTDEGSLFAKLDSLPKEGVSEIRTPVAIAGSRGTRLEIRHAKTEGTALYNFSGDKTSKVSLYNIDPQTKSIARDSYIDVPKNRQAAVAADGKLPSQTAEIPADIVARADRLIREIDDRARDIQKSGRQGKASDLKKVHEHAEAHSTCPVCRSRGISPGDYHK